MVPGAATFEDDMTAAPACDEYEEEAWKEPPLLLLAELKGLSMENPTVLIEPPLSRSRAGPCAAADWLLDIAAGAIDDEAA